MNSVIWNILNMFSSSYITSIWRRVNQISDTLQISNISGEFPVHRISVKRPRDPITHACLQFIRDFDPKEE